MQTRGGGIHQEGAPAGCEVYLLLGVAEVFRQQWGPCLAPAVDIPLEHMVKTLKLTPQRLQLCNVIHVCGHVLLWSDLDDVAQAQPHLALHCLIAPEGKGGASASASQLHHPTTIMSTNQSLHLHHRFL